MAELPTDDLLLTEDEEFDAAFFDPDAEYDEEPEIEVAPRAYGRTWQFDLATGRIAKYGDRPVEISGLDNLRQWIDIAMNTTSLAHPIFPDDYGMDDPYNMVGEEYSPALEADYQDQIITALTFHDRIVGVDNFNFQFDSDEQVVYVTFTVRVDDEDEDTIQINNPYGMSFEE